MEQDIYAITFEDADTPATIATKTVLIHAGSSQLKAELKKLNIEYTKVNRGLLTFYCLKGKGIDGTLRIKL